MTDDVAVAAERLDDRIVVRTTYRDKELAKAIPGHRWDNDSGYWHYPLSWASCLALRATFGERLLAGPELTRWARHEYATRVEPAWRLRSVSDAEGDADLRPYQRVGVAFLAIARQALLGDDMGLGKTAQLIRTLRLLDALGYDVFPALIVCPAGIRTQWAREFERWWPDGPTVAIVEGTATKRRRALEALAAGEAEVGIINWENLRAHSRLAPYGSVRLRRCEVCDPEGAPGKRQASCHWCPKELNALEFRTVVADEIHRAKDPQAQQTRGLWAVAHQPTVAFRYGLTGTPVDATIDQLWPLMHFVTPEEYPSKTAFIDRYALQTWNAFGGMELVGIRADTRDEFFGFFDPRFLRRPKNVALPYLPEKTRIVREVALTPKQKKLYKELSEEMIARLDDGETLAVFNPLTETTRLNQAAASNLLTETCERCDGTGERPDYHEAAPHPEPAYSAGWCYCAKTLDDPIHELKCRGCGGRGILYVPSLPSNKLDELLTLLDEIGDAQTVVFAVSRRLIELAATQLEKRGISYVMFTGAVTQAARDVNVAAFGRGEARVALCTIDAAGEGLDGLQVADTAIYLQRHYSRLKNAQSEDRIHRMGQDSDKVVIVDVISEGTIEWDKEVILAQKEDRFQELVRDEETLRRLLNRDFQPETSVAADGVVA